MRSGATSIGTLGPGPSSKPYVGLELGGTQDLLAPPEPLRCLRTTLASMARAVLRAEDKERLRELHAWLDEAWSTDQGAV